MLEEMPDGTRQSHTEAWGAVRAPQGCPGMGGEPF